ncbi:uncharacterized protein C17orf113-like [Mercenaria mercenaria]|uniref:uncharacterized protein C17orf113-like n=1 Tax=Mercenaria mercenaria TaxID=6596 RepID=UPI00234EE988|nr:uncharacterized protein C17orf113-like [Mercenaria mercenaria]
MSQSKLSAFGFTAKDAQTNDARQGSSEECQPSTSTDTSCSKIPKKYPKRFQNKWLSEFSWLKFDSEKGTMHCLTCSKPNVTSSASIFVTGCKNFQRSALVRHQDSDEHRSAALAVKQKMYMDTAVKVVAKGMLPILEAQLRTALYMASENIANRKFLSMIHLQIANTHRFAASAGTSMDPVERQHVKGIYTNHQTPAKLQGYLANVLQEMAIVRIHNSPFIGIMVDESLDIATTKKLVMFCKIINNGEIRIEFCSNIDIVNGKAETVYDAIVSWLQSVGIQSDRVSGFGSDGAAVMTGKRSGVGVRLQADNPRIIHIWCAVHRVALVSYWAAKKIPYLQKVQSVLINIYNFYEYSAPRYNKIRELKTLMGGKVKKFKKPTQVRWLSLQDAIESVYNSWSSLVLWLEHEVASAPQSEGGNKAKGILKEVKTFKFISTVCLLKDILASLCKVSRFFQKDVIDIHHVVSMITATRDTLSAFERPDSETSTVLTLLESIEESGMFQGITLTCSLRDRAVLCSVRRNFVRHILREFDERFPADDMAVLKDMNFILNPSLLPGSQQGIIEHGVDSLNRVLNFFGDMLNAQETRDNFMQFKFLLNVNRQLSLQNMCLLLVSTHNETYPNFAKMASVLMTVPLTSVPCERGFSSQNRHVSKFTSKRLVKNVENRMTIEYYMKQKPNTDEIIQRAVEKCNLAAVQ